MNSRQVRVSAVAYALGENARHHSELPHFQEKVAAFGMPYDTRLWGLGQYRRTDRSKVELAAASARQTMHLAGLHPKDVDTIVVCAVTMPAVIADQVAFTQALAGALDMGGTPVLGVTLGRCATLLAGIRMARCMALSGEDRNILVIGIDTASSEDDRFDRFALFSDGAASCLVSSATAAGYAIIRAVWQGTAIGDAAPFDFDAGLARQVTGALDISGGPGAVSKVFHDNLFEPIVAMREGIAGFGANQLYLSNIARFGHCFACDPLINLCDSEAAAPMAPDSLFLLACSTPGIRVALLLRNEGGSAAQPVSHIGASA